MVKKLILLASFILLGFFAPLVSAHEAHVLPYDTFWSGLMGPFSTHAFDALNSAHNLRVTAIIVSSVFILLILNFLFRNTEVGQNFHGFFEKYSKLGPHFVRVSVAFALIFSGLSQSFLGPELKLTLFSEPTLVSLSLIAIGVMFLFGFLTELAALSAVLIFIWSFFVFGSYVFTYSNYLGEFIVLLLFGMRVFSVDRYLFGKLKKFSDFERYETLIIRIFYGFALIFAAITVKLLHPDLTIAVVNSWHLTRFHWLFPSDPLLVTFGAGVVEMVIGLFIIFGFEMRLTILISLFYITLSLFYFRELVWPHLLLYGISLNLLVQPEVFTVDHLLFKKHRMEKSWWRRIFSPHNEEGKSVVS